MNLHEFLDTLPAPGGGAPSDDNIPLLMSRLDVGARAVGCQVLKAGVGTLKGPVLLVRLRTGQGTTEEWVPVGLGARARGILRARMPTIPLGDGARDGADCSRALSSELATLLEATSELDPSTRTERLADWMLEHVRGSRCAVVPVEAGAFGEPLVFRLRGAPPGDARHLPRGVLQRVARARQPLVNHDARSGAADLLPTDTVVRQRVRSYMAVPVVSRHDVLAVAYLDRLEEGGRFSVDEQAAFQAFAYDLARPLLRVRHARRERDLVLQRDALLSGGAGARPAPSPALAAVIAQAARLAPAPDHSLLVLGETGVGKEWLARIAHEASGRTGRFVSVNVAALPASLFESELHGTARGAYTGAVERGGLASAAEGGTLFLDEIGDLELTSQVALLRFVQERVVRPVGGQDERRADIRLIAATNRPLADMVRSGTFRADLLHRFSRPLIVPPLRERREEILPLAEWWLDARARSGGLGALTLTDDARALLLRHSWPGNVRELQVVLGHAALVAEDGRVDAALLESLLADDAGAARDDGAGADELRSWADYEARRDADEARWLTAALQERNGNVEGTARAIGCPSSTLRRLLKRHGIGAAG